MDKEEAIQRFKDVIRVLDTVTLSNGEIIDRRESAVKHQYTRDVFEVDDDKGRIRIYGETLIIVVFHTVSYAKSIGSTSTFESKISKEEYYELKKIYFGNFKEDKEYLKKLHDSIIKK